MRRIDDLLEAATSRFRYDAGLREEIARELRAHLEDSIAAARAEGKADAEAEEAAIRAFGDPEEVGEKLWQANRRRLRRRAVVMAAVGVVLMPAGFLAAGWLITSALGEGVAQLPRIIGVSAVAVILLYQLTRRFLPKTALFGLDYLWWLAAAFGKSFRIAFRNAWIWAPALAAFALNFSINVFSQPRFFEHRLYQFTLKGPGLWNCMHDHLYQGPQLYGISATVLFCLPFLILAARMRDRLQAASGLGPIRGRRWLIAMIVSAYAGFLVGTMWLLGLLSYMGFSSSRILALRQSIPSCTWIIFVCASIPFSVLIDVLFLTIVLRRLRGQPVTLAGVVNSAFAVIWPMTWLFLIASVRENAGMLLAGNARALRSLQVIDFLFIATAFLPVIIVSERCGLRRACVLFGDFVRRHLWRYVAFVFLSALLLVGLPRWAVGEAFGSADVSWPVYLWVTLAHASTYFALQLGLTVMCFEFYLTRAGTIVPMAAEEAAPQIPPE